MMSPSLGLLMLLFTSSNAYLRGLEPLEEINLCFCESCTSSVLENDADAYSCRERIMWLQRDIGHSEIDACRQVAGEEFPDECDACDPDSCQVQDFCGVASCTMEVLETPACNDALGGCHSCGERIKYLVREQGMRPRDACSLVSAKQFPEECGKCSATEDIAFSLTQAPAPSPGAQLTQKPTGHHSVQPTSSFAARLEPNICNTETCTPDVLSTMACDDNRGGCHTCGDRINYLIKQEKLSPTDACQKIGFEQFMASCGGCMPSNLREPVSAVDPSKLVWSDEFDDDGALDPTRWSFDVGSGNWGWGNNEMQYYTDRLDNAFVMDGILNIRAVRESYGGKAYTSARVKTLMNGDWTYGRIQIRARLSNGLARGTWAALWMLPTDGVYGGWPSSGEIDIMEHVGFDQGAFHGTIHTDSFNHMKGTHSGGQMKEDANEWHIYEIDWSEDKIDFILNGFRYHSFQRQLSGSFREWPFDQRFHLIFNVAVGGTWGSKDGVDEKSFDGVGQIMEIDWVRVYEQ